MELKINPEYEKVLHPLKPEEFEALKESIKSDGILAPIVINEENVILDGHHRYKIIKELKIEEFPTLVKSFKSPVEELGFVLSVNYKRRHANSFQLAEIGMKLLEVEQKKAKERMSQHPNGIFDATSGKAVGQVAKQIGLSQATFERAKKIIEKAPEKVKELCRTESLTIGGTYQVLMATEGIPKTFQESLLEEYKNQKMTPKEIKGIVMATEAVKSQLEGEEELIKTTMEEILKPLYYTKDLKPKIAEWQIEEAAKDSHKTVKGLKPASDVGQTFEEANAWFNKYGGKCLGEVKYWEGEWDHIKELIEKLKAKESGSETEAE